MNRVRSRPLLFAAAGVALSAGLATAVAAQARPDSASRRDSAARHDSALALETVRVRAAYAPRVIGSASAVTVSPDSAALGVAAATMGEMMRRLPFLYVRQNSRGESELSVRGSESRQAAVLFEGVPLALTWDARADVSAVPLAGVRQIDYVRGLSSLLSGPNAIGGVVTARLWEDHDPERAPARLRRAEVQADQLGGVRTSGALGGALHHSAASSLQYRVGAGWRDLQGVARPHAVDEPGGNEPVRRNTDSRAYDAFGGLRYQHAQGRYLSGFASVTDGERGVAPELHLSAPRLWRNPEVSRRIASISAGTGALQSRFGIGDVEAALSVNDGTTEINSFADRTYSSVTGTELGEDRTTTLRVTFDQQLGARVTLRGAFTESSIRYLETIGTDPTGRYRQRLSSMAAEVDVTAARFVTITAGLAQDAATTDEAAGLPPLGRKAGLGWRTGVTWLLPDQGVRLHASASARKRFPSLRELYSGALDRFEPNPALRPETARSAEIGASLARGRFDMQAVVFRQQIEDAVVRVTLPSDQFQRVNRDRFTSTGLEITAGMVLGMAALRGDVTLQSARIADATIVDPTLRRPEDVPAFFGSVRAMVPLAEGLEGHVRGRALGATRCTNVETGSLEQQGGAQTLDLGVERRWSASRGLGAVMAGLQVENVLDRALYDKCGLPQAGRTLRFVFRIG
jgi:iron complex outermembrane receptor protein